MTDYAHALPPLDNRKGTDYADPSARCGGAGRVALFAEDVTCPDCIEQMAADTLRAELRAGVERAERTVSSAVLDLSVWEGRGDWSALPAEQRHEAAVRGLAHLDEAITALIERRGELRAALGIVDEAAPVLHWPSPGLRTTTQCQGEPLTAEDFAQTEAAVTCPKCRANLGGA